MKFKLNNLEFELEGEQEVVKSQFEDFKSFIVGSLLPSINSPQGMTPAEVEGRVVHSLPPNSEQQNAEIGDLPPLREVALKDLPKTETDWILVYACYITKLGTATFTEQSIKEYYTKSGRSNHSRLANLSNNIKSLLNRDFIKMHNDTEYIIKPAGLTHAKGVFDGKSSSKASTHPTKGKQGSSSGNNDASSSTPAKKSSPSKSFALDKNLNLRPHGKESLKDFAAKHRIDSVGKHIVVSVHYLKDILGLGEVNENHIYTCLNELNVRIPKAL